MMSFLLLWISTLFFGAQCQYPGAPPAEPVDYPMIPTDSNFENFQCFSEDEIASLRKEFEITNETLEIDAFISFKVDDWSIPSLLTSIINREIIGSVVELYSFYEGAVSLIADLSTETSVIHHEIIEKDYGFGSPKLDPPYTTDIPMRTRWLIHDDAVTAMEAELSTDMNLYLDLWRSYVHPAVLEVMNSSNEIVIQPDDEGLFACTEQHGCLHGDSTWYPPQCNFTTNVRCMVLLQFLPEHDMEMNRDLIVDEELPIVIKYMGDEKTAAGQSNFQRFYEERSRVIFQLRSTETQSISALGWTTIALPGDGEIMKNQAVLMVATRLHSVSQCHFLFYYFAATMMKQSQVDQIRQGIFEANEPETKDLRLQVTCDWLKNPMNQQRGGWGLWVKSSFTESTTKTHCVNVPDESLAWLRSKSDDELVSGAYSDSSYYSKIAGIMHLYQALYAKRHCISRREEDDNGALLIVGYILSALTLTLILGVFVATIKWREQTIMRTASRALLIMIQFGGVIALSYCLFPKHDIASQCVARKFIFQIGFGFMFGGLGAKTWALHRMLEDLKLLKDSEIFNSDLIVKAVGIVILVTFYVSILLWIFPMEIEEQIENGKISSHCEWDDSAETAYQALLGVEVVILFVTGKLAWSLKAPNAVYNAQRFITAIYGGAVFVLSGYLVSELVVEGPLVIVIESYLVTLLVILVISVLFGPKFAIILSEKMYLPDHFESDTIKFSSSVLTREDVRAMRRLCRKHGYHIAKKDEVKLDEANLSITGTTRLRRSQRLGSRSSKAVAS